MVRRQATNRTPSLAIVGSGPIGAALTATRPTAISRRHVDLVGVLESSVPSVQPATVNRCLRVALSLLVGFAMTTSTLWASHSLGTAQDITPVAVGPGGGIVTYSDPGAKFLILRLTANAGSTGDQIRVTLPYGDDVLDLVAGQQVWTRPAPGSSVNLQYLDNGNGLGGAVIDKTGRGTIIDLFQLGTFVEPTFSSAGLCDTIPDWDEVACLDDGDPTQSLIKQTARSAGMFVMVSASNVSSCSATLIDDDLILTAAHCVSETNYPPGDVDPVRIASGSFTLDFRAADCFGNPPVPNNPRFFKLTRAVRAGFTDPPNSGLDYAVVQIDTSPAPGGLGVPPIQIRPSTTPLTMGDQVFGIHHPRGSRKKVSQSPPTPLCSVSSASASVTHFNCDVDNGSSGSSIFDTSGRIIGVADWAGGCGNMAQSATVVRPDFLTPLPLPADIDTVAVFDRSGSMNLSAPGGGTKLSEAKQAASLFFDLLKTDATHQAGLVTFNHGVTTDHDLAPITGPIKTDLIRETPTPGKVHSITAGGATSIGKGLERAQQRLDAFGAANTPTILLMTDGLQNTSPMIEAVEDSLAGTRICAVGFGSEASLDGPLLTKLARDNGGLYTRADRGLDLRKFFALCFGDIFESGISMDPTYHLHQGVTESEEIPIPVCGETDMTVVVAWENPFSLLVPSLRTPGGAMITAASVGVTASSGPTWSYLRFKLPLAGERDGTWTLTVHRPRGHGEFPRPLDHEDFAVVSIIDGGPKLVPVRDRLLYTGDVLKPLVTLRDPEGNLYDADVTVEVQRPVEGTGNLLTESGLGPPRLVDGDQLDARVSTLLSLEEDAGGALIPTTSFSLTLRDDGIQDEGAMEPDSQYGARVPDLLTREGNYTFYASARFGGECTAQRETFWTSYVAVGVDPELTGVESEPAGSLPDGRSKVRVRLTPRDRYGNYVGPGRGDSLDVGDRPGSEVLGEPTDEGDGSYSVDVAWDPDSGEPPGVSIDQPERPSVDLPGEPSADEPTLVSKGRAYGLAFGSALPVGTLNATLDPGFGALVSYRHRLAPRTSLVAGLGYAGFDGDGVPDLALFDLTLAARLDTRPDPATRFFVKGGLGYYAPETDLGGGSAGIHLGVGIDVPIRGPAANPPLELEMSLEGHRLFDGEREPDFLRALVGLVVRH